MIFCESAGPVYRQSFKETPFDLLEASKTILSFVVCSNDSMMRQVVNPSNFTRGWFTDFLHNPSFDLVSDHGIIF